MQFCFNFVKSLSQETYLFFKQKFSMIWKYFNKKVKEKKNYFLIRLYNEKKVYNIMQIIRLISSKREEIFDINNFSYQLNFLNKSYTSIQHHLLDLSYQKEIFLIWTVQLFQFFFEQNLKFEHFCFLYFFVSYVQDVSFLIKLKIFLQGKIKLFENKRIVFLCEPEIFSIYENSVLAKDFFYLEYIFSQEFDHIKNENRKIFSPKKFEPVISVFSYELERFIFNQVNFLSIEKTGSSDKMLNKMLIYSHHEKKFGEYKYFGFWKKYIEKMVKNIQEEFFISSIRQCIFYVYKFFSRFIYQKKNHDFRNIISTKIKQLDNKTRFFLSIAITKIVEKQNHSAIIFKLNKFGN